LVRNETGHQIILPPLIPATVKGVCKYNRERSQWVQKVGGSNPLTPIRKVSIFSYLTAYRIITIEIMDRKGENARLSKLK
jgi:hypothetical protein